MINGVFLLDKPKNITSNKALYLVKKKVSPKKAGIVGILDPLASGMLPIVINEGTKLAKYIENKDKEYVAVAKLGYVSTTGDSEGIITSSKNITLNKLTNKDIEEVIEKFIGPQKQTPPMYSGLKINGIKLYKLARKGINVNRKSRDIYIYDLKIESINNDEIIFRISCSKGTYIRTLIESIGKSLGVGAYTKDLRRIRVGTFIEKNMITLQDLTNIDECIIPLEKMVSDMTSITISSKECQTLKYGQKVYTKLYKNIEEIVIKNENFNLIGVGTIINNYIHSKRLINFDE